MIEIVLKGTDAYSKMLGKASKDFTGLKAVAVAAGSAIAAAFTVRALKDFAEGLADIVLEGARTADEMGKLAQKSGIAVEQFSQLSYAADLSNVSNEELVRGLKSLSQEMVKAGRGGESVFEELLKISDEFADSADGANKTAEAVRRFGKSGQELIPLLNQGSDAIRETMQEADAFGLTISSDFAAKAGAFEDNLKRMEYALRGFRLELTREVLPALVNLSAGLLKLSKDAGGPVNLFKGLLHAFGVIRPEIGLIIAGLEKVSDVGEKAIKNTDQKDLVNPDDVEKALRMLDKIDASRKRGSAAIIANAKLELDAQLDTISKLNITEGDRQTLRISAEAEYQEKITELKQQGELQRADMDRFYRNGEVENFVNALNAQQTAQIEWVESMRNVMRTYQELWQESFFNIKAAAVNFSMTAAKSISDGLGTAIANIATNTQSASEAFAAFGRSLLAMLVKWAAQLVINSVLALAIGAATSKATIAMISPIASAWAVAATAAAIATFGGATASGAAVIPAMALNAGIAGGMVAAFGSAHAGLTNVPQDATYILQRGERVLSREQNQDFRDWMQSGSQMVHVTVNLGSQVLMDEIKEASRDGRLTLYPRALLS